MSETQMFSVTFDESVERTVSLKSSQPVPLADLEAAIENISREFLGSQKLDIEFLSSIPGDSPSVVGYFLVEPEEPSESPLFMKIERISGFKN